MKGGGGMGAILSLQITIFALVAVGFAVRRLGLVGEQGQRNLNDLVIYCILPCNILKAFAGDVGGGGFSAYLGIFGISLGLQAFCVAYGKLVFRKEAPGRRKCLEYGTICSNAGFLGNPIAEGLYGAEGLALASVYLIPQRVMMWGAGLPVFSGERDWRASVKKVVTHPCILACVLGILRMGTGVQLPEAVMGTVNALGNCNTAMSMLVIGMILAQIDLKTLWDPTVLKYSLHRLVILPLLVYLVCRLLPVSRTVLGVTVVLAAMPAGATTSILAEKYRMEPEFATKLVIFSTLLSLPTVALWSFFLG